MKKWFKGINTLEELKKEFKKLALEYHPDRPNGNLRIMQEINAEYQEEFEMLQKGTENKENAADFMDIIDKIINFDLDIEICGSWVWVSGNTRAYKTELKEAGFWWASKKLMWYWHSKEETHRRKSSMSIDDIRIKYGSEKVTTTFRPSLA